MSTLEKTIDLLETLPDNKIETVYAFVRFIGSDTYKAPSKTEQTKINDVKSRERRQKGFDGLLSKDNIRKYNK